ncbi:MAG: hypothetical protein BGP05_18250 [Rhizobiales bacterium 62-47]|nr:hypothetical protein [Hyphomicrobiales bacterium]OJY09727.1 MAG: hypothetical protein BGP05_18250 [Rhizobiales bacterium 62-47]
MKAALSKAEARIAQSILMAIFQQNVMARTGSFRERVSIRSGNALAALHCTGSWGRIELEQT